jgi:2-oxoglutarate ferredoxin oxidoreductase subunit beta
MSEILSAVDGAAYLERVAVNSPAHIQKTKRAIRKAFQAQIDKLGFSMVEILSPCPTNWKMNPLQSWQWIDKEMTRVFPLGVYKDVTGKKDAD